MWEFASKYVFVKFISLVLVWVPIKMRTRTDADVKKHNHALRFGILLAFEMRVDSKSILYPTSPLKLFAVTFFYFNPKPSKFPGWSTELCGMVLKSTASRNQWKSLLVAFFRCMKSKCSLIIPFHNRHKVRCANTTDVLADVPTDILANILANI